MTFVDASVALKWFVDGEPLVVEARAVLDAIAEDPRPYAVPELFGVWLTADAHAAARVRQKRLVRVLAR